MGLFLNKKKMEMAIMDEYAIKRQIRDLTFFMWMQGIAIVVIAFIALPASCEKIDKKDIFSQKSEDGSRRPPRDRRSMPYQGRPQQNPDMRRMENDR